MIHGMAKDFEEDHSKELSYHINRDLTHEEKEIGERASFGMMDVLIPSNSNPMFLCRKIFKNYFQEGLFDDLRILSIAP